MDKPPLLKLSKNENPLLAAVRLEKKFSPKAKSLEKTESYKTEV